MLKRFPAYRHSKVKMEKARELLEAAIQAKNAGDSDEAIRLYEQASLVAPDRPGPRLRLAFLLLEQRKWKQAIRVARQITKRWPGCQPAYVIVAQSYSQLERWKFAERFFREALAINEEPNIRVLLAYVLSQMERNDEAEECLHKSLEVNPDNDEAHYNLGRVYKAKGELATAEKHLKRAIEIDPKYALAYAELGALLAGQIDRAKEAVGMLQKAIEYEPNDGWSLAYLTHALRLLGEIEAADEQYRRLLDLWPDRSMPYWLYGNFLAEENDGCSAAEYYLRKAVEIDPEDQWANFYLGKYLHFWDQNDEAKKLLTKAARLGYSKARELLQSMESTPTK